MTSYLDRARTARAIKAGVLGGRGGFPAHRREAAAPDLPPPPAADGAAAPAPGARIEAGQREPAP